MGQTSSNLGENGPPGATQVRRLGRARDPQDKAAICPRRLGCLSGTPALQPFWWVAPVADQCAACMQGSNGAAGAGRGGQTAGGQMGYGG